mmetsp:Transcript_2401/g.7343  ORF Transcript_2401/g.7343 Transcript_2401/m.7343 type:complete len:86 (+) Transcript_2401:1099-1356(+)
MRVRHSQRGFTVKFPRLHKLGGCAPLFAKLSLSLLASGFAKQHLQMETSAAGSEICQQHALAAEAERSVLGPTCQKCLAGAGNIP